MSTVLSFIGKGGTGKTSISLLFADLLKKKGKKVLLADLDPQASLSITVLDRLVNVSMLDVYRKDLKVKEILLTNEKGLDIIPACTELYEINREMILNNDNSLFIKKELRKFYNYDYIITDNTGSSFDEIAKNVIMATDKYIFLLQPGKYSTNSIVEYIKYCRKIKNDPSMLFYVVPNFYNPCRFGCYTNLQAIKKYFINDEKVIVLDEFIPSTVSFENTLLTKKRSLASLLKINKSDQKILDKLEEIVNIIMTKEGICHG